jgi:hypothetical protein
MQEAQVEAEVGDAAAAGPGSEAERRDLARQLRDLAARVERSGMSAGAEPATGVSTNGSADPS